MIIKKEREGSSLTFASYGCTVVLTSRGSNAAFFRNGGGKGLFPCCKAGDRR